MSDLLRLLRIGHAARGTFALGALLALVVVLANVALLGLAGWFITAMAAAGIAGAAINYFTPSAGIRAFAILRTGGRYLERVVNHDATLKLLCDLRVWLYRRIQPLAPAVLQRYRKGDVLTRLVANVDILDNAWLRIFTPAAVALAAGIAMFVFLSRLVPAVAWVDLALLACIGVALPVFTAWRGRAPAKRAAAAGGALKAALADDFAGLAELAAMNAAPGVCAQRIALSAQVVREQRRGLHLEAMAAGATIACTGIAIALTWRLGAPAVRAHRISPLMLPVLVFIVLASTEAVQALPAAFRALGDTLAAARRIFTLADERPEVAEPRQPERAVESASLAFQHVHFRYGPRLPEVLAGVDFALPAGAAIAVVGPSGAGKSSIAQLALRFHDPQHGTVHLGGKPLDRYALRTLRTRFAWAGQSTRLFSTTIRENLRIARPAATDDQLWDALAAAAIADEVRGFDAGLDHFVGAGGTALSAGQARRLALARAWLSPAPVLLLDEPMDGLDGATAQRIVDRFVTGRGRRSLLWITHQVLALERMDQILVLDRGRIAARGTHAELLRTSPYYRHMARTQAWLRRPRERPTTRSGTDLRPWKGKPRQPTRTAH